MPDSVQSSASDGPTHRGSSRRTATVIGRMYLEGILSEAEAKAGFLYAESVGAYECMKGHPPRHRQSPNFEFGRNSANGLDPETLRARSADAADRLVRLSRRKCTAIQKQYDQVQSHVPVFPILISIVLEEVCCNDRPVHSLHHHTLKATLRTLAKKVYGFDVGERRKADPSVRPLR